MDVSDRNQHSATPAACHCQATQVLCVAALGFIPVLEITMFPSIHHGIDALRAESVVSASNGRFVWKKELGFGV
jgi:hypothetical protein